MMQDIVTMTERVDVARIVPTDRRPASILAVKTLPTTSVKETITYSPDWTLDKRSVDAVQWIEERMPDSLLTLPRFTVVPATARTDRTEKSLWMRRTNLEYRKAYDELRGEFGELDIEEQVNWHGNILVNSGMAAIWNALSGTSITSFSNANAYIGVGDSNSTPLVNQTDLIAFTNKLRKGMNATFPDQPANSQLRFQSDFTGSEANFSWLEVATFNAGSGGTMLQRVTPSGGLGTKSSGSTWTITLLLTLS